MFYCSECKLFYKETTCKWCGKECAKVSLEFYANANIRNRIVRENFIMQCENHGVFDPIENKVCPICLQTGQEKWVDSRLKNEIQVGDFIHPWGKEYTEHQGQTLIRSRCGIETEIGGYFRSSSSPGTQGTVA